MSELQAEWGKVGEGAALQSNAKRSPPLDPAARNDNNNNNNKYKGSSERKNLNRSA